jgi:hypothetical protein
MPTTETKEDPRLAELAAVNCRLKTVLAFLKTKHTSDSLNGLIESAQIGLGDHTPAFVRVENTFLSGTRHMDSLIRMAEALEVKAEIGQADHALEECTRLLERKVALLHELSDTSAGL